MGVQFFVPVNTKALAVSGQSTLASLNVDGVPGTSGKTELEGDLAVHGEIVFDCSGSGGVDISYGHLTVGGLVTANGGLTVAGPANLYSLNTVSGVMSTIGGHLKVNGETTLDAATGYTRPLGDDSTHISTTAFVKRAIDVEQTRALAGPAFSGVPTAPTAALTDNSTQIATTGFVNGMINILTTVSPNTLTLIDTLSTALAADTGPNGVQNAILKVVTDETTRAGNVEAALQTRVGALESYSSDDSAFATKNQPTFTGNVTVSTGNVVLSSTNGDNGRIQFAGRDSSGALPYFMGVDANSPFDQLVIKKGPTTIMSISDDGVSGSPYTQNITFSAPVVMTDLLNLKDCKIQLGVGKFITGANLLVLLTKLDTETVKLITAS